MWAIRLTSESSVGRETIVAKLILRLAFALAILYDTSSFFLVVTFAAQAHELLSDGRYLPALGVAALGVGFGIFFVKCVQVTRVIGTKLEAMK